MRNLGWILVVVSSMACSSTALKGADGGGGSGGAGTGGGAGTSGGAAGLDAGVDTAVAPLVIEVPAEPSREVDLLFVIDNSQSMATLQKMFAASFPTFINVLRMLPGQQPDLHIGVISSDLGAGAYDASDIPGCRRGGDQGILQNAPRGTTCATGSLNGGQRFIKDADGVKNYAGTLEDTFACIAALGDQGCGFESQFGSLMRALGADGNGGAPAENTGFLRPNALLSITILTNEDDCSAPLNSMFYDPTSRYVSDPLGPLASFRCNEFGHLCGGQKPSRTTAATLNACTSAEDGRLLKVADVAARLKGLKTDPNKILLTTIAGPPTPYAVQLGAPTLADDPSPWPSIAHSCMPASGSYADPGVRMRELTDAFGGNGVFQSICSASFQPAAQRIAEEIGQTMALPCLEGVPSASVQTSCQAVDHFEGSNGRQDVPLKTCAATAGVAPCWETDAPTATCASGELRIRRPAQRGGLQSTTFTCQR